MRCWIELNARALRQNYRTLKHQADQAIFVPIIKSNAYGHGLHEVYQILSRENPEWLGVNYLFEGKRLRELGYQGKILVVGPIRNEDIAEAYNLRCEVFLGNQSFLKAWIDAPQKPTVHIKFDTGMSRQGFLEKEADEIIKALLPHKALVSGFCSHFANVEDVLDHKYALEQVQRFNRIYDAFAKQQFKLKRHIASSASTLILKDCSFDLVRVGISLYGVWPSSKTRLSFMQLNGNLPDLQPVLQWKTEVAALKEVLSGQFIGYGCTYRAVHDMKVAVLPVGYYEGYSRIAGQKFSYVLIRGQRCPIVGRICMNMMMVDVTHVPDIQADDVVTLIGMDGEETLEAATVAEWAETIHYELFTNLNPEIPRRILEDL